MRWNKDVTKFMMRLVGERFGDSRDLVGNRGSVRAAGLVWWFPTFATEHPSDEDLSLGTPVSREDGARISCRGRHSLKSRSFTASATADFVQDDKLW